MALLRKCLLDLRMKRGEGSACCPNWMYPTPAGRGADLPYEPRGANHDTHSSLMLEADSLATADAVVFSGKDGDATVAGAPLVDTGTKPAAPSGS